LHLFTVLGVLCIEVASFFVVGGARASVPSSVVDAPAVAGAPRDESRRLFRLACEGGSATGCENLAVALGRRGE
jgi:hypothetical protein